MPAGGAETALVSIGDRVQVGSYAVHSRFSRVVNFVNDRTLVSLVAPEVGRGPVNIVVRGADFSRLDRLTVTPDLVNCNRHSLRIDHRLTFRSQFPVNLRRARCIAGQLDEFTRSLCAGAPAGSLAFLLTADRHAEVLSAFDRNCRARFRAGVSALFTGRAMAGIEQIKGLGPGLTPSGDDFIAGLLAALPVVEQLQRVRLDRLRQSVYDAAQSGNRLVNSFLQMAREGCYFARFRDVLVALVRGRAGCIRTKTQDLLAMGETSGCDMGVGFLMTVRQGGMLCR